MSVSRRDALVGATAAAVVASVPVAVQADDVHLEALCADWRTVTRTWEAVYDAMDLHRNVPEPVLREAEVHNRMRAAFLRFMDAPARTPGGVLLKLTSFMDEDEWQELAKTETMDEVMLVAVRRDLERLAGEAQS